MHIFRQQIILLFSLVTVSFFSCTEEEDPTCIAPRQITAVSFSVNQVTLNFVQETSENFRVEYCLSGFELGEGEIIQFSGNSINILGLSQGTEYDFYVSTICTDNGLSSTSEKFTFTTPAFICDTPTNVAVEVLDYNEAIVSWNNSSEATSFTIEYGLSGFELGTGIEKPSVENQLLIDALIVGTTYDVYVRANCKNISSPNSAPVTFITRACLPPIDVLVKDISENSFILDWDGRGEVTWEIEYGQEGFALGIGTVVFTGDIPLLIENLESQTVYDVYIRANCGPNGRSEYIGPLKVATL